MLRELGVWKLTVTGPPALLDAFYGEVEVRGFSGDDEFERRNLEYDACQQVATDMGYKSYDDMPEQFTPVTFGMPVRSKNKYVTAEGTQQWFVGVYSVDRCYGGPEEGGWWYDTGELVQSTAVSSCEEAEELRARLYGDEFPDTGKSYSVLGGDDYRIIIGIEPPAEYFPKKVPHYE
jgi:hypothetical protein